MFRHWRREVLYGGMQLSILSSIAASKENVELFRLRQVTFNPHASKANFRLAELFNMCRDSWQYPVNNQGR